MQRTEVRKPKRRAKPKQKEKPKRSSRLRKHRIRIPEKKPKRKIRPEIIQKAREKKEVQSISLVSRSAFSGQEKNGAKIVIGVRESVRLNPVITPTDAADQRVTYKSSNNKVASVTQGGVIRAKKKRKCRDHGHNCKPEDLPHQSDGQTGTKEGYDRCKKQDTEKRKNPPA